MHASRKIEEDEEGEKNPTGRTLFTNVKHSAHIKMPTLAYTIESMTIYPEKFLQIETSHIVWDKEAVDISADQAIAATRSGGKNGGAKEASNEIKNFLRTMLAEGKGSCKQTDMAEQARALGYSDKELRTARENLGIIFEAARFWP